MKFELKIVNENTTILHEIIGITEERRLELSAHLDKMSRELTEEYKNGVSVPVVINKIGKFCETLEEFSYCLFVHTWWLVSNHAVENANSK